MNKTKTIWLDSVNNITVVDGHYKHITLSDGRQFIQKEWKHNHWQTHEILPAGVKAQAEQDAITSAKKELLDKATTRRERYDIKQKLYFPKELVLHQIYVVPKTKGLLDIKDRPMGMENAIRWFYRSGNSLSREDIEDAFMDALYNAQLKGKFKSANTVYGHTKTLQYRTSATNLGKTQRGETPLKGLRPHIGNKYGEDGENLIEKMGYDYKGDLIIGSNK